MSFLTALSLSNFRSYETVKCNDLPCGLIALYGANGAGKTNMLEAVSLLSPGRGLRKAKPIDMQNNAYPQMPWAVSATVKMRKDADIEHRIGTGSDPNAKKRIVRINGDTEKSQAALADYMACVWLTPQMDGLFIGSSSDRRRFLDRMIYAFDPAHVGRLTRYENAMRQRSKLLQDTQKSADPHWLNALEKQMAETGMAIAASRVEFVVALQQACDNFRSEEFPHAIVSIDGLMENDARTHASLDIEEKFQMVLANNRSRDAITGGAINGPHKSDMQVVYASKSVPAAQCSTGEQKALLIGIILANAFMMHARRGVPPVLLMDEIAAHLDANRQTALYDVLEETGGQIWLTGTERTLFDPIYKRARLIHIGGD